MTEVSFLPRDCFNRHGEPKVVFETKRAAKAVAAALNWGAPHVYRCPRNCPGYHLGNGTDEEE